LLKPDSGIITINNKTPGAEINRKMSLFFGGTTQLYERLTARENISFYAKLHNVTQSEEKERIELYSKLLHMQSYLDKKTAHFSHGMKHKTALVRLMIHNPATLLLDEPTTGMDVPSIEALTQFVNQLKADRKTILYSSHSIKELEKVCDIIFILHNRSIVKTIQLGNIKHKRSEYIEKEYLQCL
jgi:sodium transport system ATP-binding protein